MSNLLLVPPRDSQLRCVNQKLSDLASEAVAAGTSLQKFPGGDAEALKAVIEFWGALGTYAQAASRSLGGDNETLPHALVTFNFLRNLGEDV